MEELVDEKMVDYDWDAQTASITAKGLEFIQS